MAAKAWVRGTMGWVDGSESSASSVMGEVGDCLLGWPQRPELVLLGVGDQIGCQLVDRLEDC